MLVEATLGYALVQRITGFTDDPIADVDDFSGVFGDADKTIRNGKSSIRSTQSAIPASRPAPSNATRLNANA